MINMGAQHVTFGGAIGGLVRFRMILFVTFKLKTKRCKESHSKSSGPLMAFSGVTCWAPIFIIRIRFLPCKSRCSLYNVIYLSLWLFMHLITYFAWLYKENYLGSHIKMRSLIFEWGFKST